MLHALLVSHFLFPKKVSCHFLMMRCILFSKYLGINRKRTEPAENGWCFKTKVVPKLWVEWLCFLLWGNFCFVLCLLISCKNWTVSRRIYMEIITIGNSDPLVNRAPSSIHLHQAHFSLQPALWNTLNNIWTKILHVIGQFSQI